MDRALMRGDGTTIPVELTMQRITDTDPQLFTGFLRDISERKEAEARILRLNRLYRTLFQTSALIVRTTERHVRGLGSAGLVDVGQRDRVPWRFRVHRRDQCLCAVDHVIVDLGDHHAAGQSTSRGRAPGHDVGDRRPVGTGVVTELHPQ